jgi:hypothetical protein
MVVGRVEDRAREVGEERVKAERRAAELAAELATVQGLKEKEERARVRGV